VVRRAAIAFVNSCAHNNPAKLRRHIKGKPISALYNETQVRPELIREVMMGPFKHKVDDGLEIRKATFECLYSLLDTCQAELDLSEFLDHVENGFKDEYDVKILAFLIILRIVSTFPAALATKIEKFVDGFKTVLTHRVKPESVKQEYEKADELKRSVLRIFNLIVTKQASIDLDQNGLRAINDLIRQIETTSDLNSMMESVKNETGSIRGHNRKTQNLQNGTGNAMEWQ
jgi:cullin-associated NEDD8-dissociated protein 1